MVRLSHIMSHVLLVQNTAPSVQPNSELIKMLRVCWPFIITILTVHYLFCAKWLDTGERYFAQWVVRRVGNTFEIKLYKTSHDTSQEANHTLAYPSIIKRQGVLVISLWIHHRATALALSFLSSLLYYSWVKWDSEIQLSNLTWTFLYRIQGMYHLAAVDKLNKGKYGLFR